MAEPDQDNRRTRRGEAREPVEVAVESSRFAEWTIIGCFVALGVLGTWSVFADEVALLFSGGPVVQVATPPPTQAGAASPRMAP
jgi:hypothetical protein